MHSMLDSIYVYLASVGHFKIHAHIIYRQVLLDTGKIPTYTYMLIMGATKITLGC